MPVFPSCQPVFPDCQRMPNIPHHPHLLTWANRKPSFEDSNLYCSLQRTVTLKSDDMYHDPYPFGGGSTCFKDQKINRV